MHTRGFEPIFFFSFNSYFFLELEENSTITTGRILSSKRMFQKCYIEVVPTKYFHYILYNHSNDYLTFDLGIAKEKFFNFFLMG